MNSITLCIGYISTCLMVSVSSSDYIILSEKPVPVTIPYNFSFKVNQSLLMSITLKNVPPSVSTIYLIYTEKQSFHLDDRYTVPEKIKINAEIKNGEVKIMFLRSLGKHRNVLVDVELATEDGICNKLRIAEGRCDDNTHLHIVKGKPVYWHTKWIRDDKSLCMVPNFCEIVADFNNRCEENFLCYYNATKYICTLNNESKKIKDYRLYQTYDDDVKKRVSLTPNKMGQGQEKEEKDVSRAKLSCWKDYTYIEEVESCYKIHTTPKSWDEANQTCTQEKSSLFYPENSDEVTAVLKFWQATAVKLHDMYVGISDIAEEGQFQTIDGKPIAEIYNKWNRDQPDNYYNNEDCVHITKDSTYNDIPCTTPYSFICKKSLLSPERNIQHNLSSLIGAPLNASAMNTKLIIELESFDNNTSFNVVPLKFFGKYKLWSKKIILPAKDFTKDNTVTTLNYSETTEVPFNCQEYMSLSKYGQTFTAVITKENKIKTFNKTQKVQRKFKMADNGSILCCLYYDYEPTSDGKELQITRFVVNKNLLVYQYLNIGGSEKQSSLLHNSWIIYVSVTLIGVSILILALYFILKRGWFNKSQPVEEAVEMNNEIDQNQVIYAALEFVNSANRPHRNQTEESHYANIVGVLHPH